MNNFVIIQTLEIDADGPSPEQENLPDCIQNTEATEEEVYAALKSSRAQRAQIFQSDKSSGYQELDKWPVLLQPKYVSFSSPKLYKNDAHYGIVLNHIFCSCNFLPAVWLHHSPYTLV